MKDLEGLRLQALLSIAKGEGPGHPFRGNQWTRRASRGRAAPKDPTAGSQGGGSGKAPKPAGKDEYLMRDYGDGKIQLRIKESALPKEVLAIHRRAQGVKEGQYDLRTGVTDSVTMHRDKASALKATKNPAQSLADHYEQQKSSVKEALLDATGGGFAGKRKREGLLSSFKTAETALSELAALGYKPTSASTPKPASTKAKGSSSSGTTPKPAKAPTAPKPTKKKTAKEKDAEWEALTPKQKKIYEKAPTDLSHDDAIALALGK